MDTETLLIALALILEKTGPVEISRKAFDEKDVDGRDLRAKSDAGSDVFRWWVEPTVNGPDYIRVGDKVVEL